MAATSCSPATTSTSSKGASACATACPRRIRKAAGAVGAMMPHGMHGRRFLRHLALDGPARYLDASTMFHADEMRRLFRTEASRRSPPRPVVDVAVAEWRRAGGRLARRGTIR